MDSNELYHWGIKGMRWGFRRYQNKDGSLTPAGKKRYNKELEKLKSEEETLKNKAKVKAKMDKLEALRTSNANRKKALDGEDDAKENSKKKAVDDESQKIKESKKQEPKSVKEMSNEELAEAITRLRLEQTYDQLQPKQVNEGKEFAKRLIENQVMPSLLGMAKDSVKTFVDSAVKKATGIDSDDIDKIVNSGTAEQVQKIMSKLTAAQKATVNKRFADDDKINERAESEKKKREDEKRRKTEARVDKEIDDAINAAEARNKKNTEKSWRDQVIDAEYDVSDIFSTKKSTESSSSSKTKTKKYETFEAEYEIIRDEPISSVPVVYSSRGESYADRYSDYVIRGRGD